MQTADDGAGGNNVRVKFTAPESGTYHLVAYSASHTIGSYRLSAIESTGTVEEPDPTPVVDPSLIEETTYSDSEIVFQPGSENGQDMYTTSYYAPFGRDVDQLAIGGWADYYYTYLKFEMDHLPDSVENATIRLWAPNFSLTTAYSASWHNTSMNLERVTEEWSEETTVWSNQPNVVQIETIPQRSGDLRWYEIDITDLYNDWGAGSFENYGIRLTPTSNTAVANPFLSSDHADVDHRPQLVLNGDFSNFNLSNEYNSEYKGEGDGSVWSTGTGGNHKNHYAFAVLKSDGSVITWGDAGSGGDSSSVSAALSNDVEKIYSTFGAFAALKSDGSVVTWGGPGGDSSSVSVALSGGVEKIYSNGGAFAALKSDGSVVTWGSGSGYSSSVSADLSSGVEKIYSTTSAFAALKSDGSVVTWGGSGGDSSSVSTSLSGGVEKIYSNLGAFAALKSDGSVVTWGIGSYGGDSSSVSAALSSGVEKIYSNAGVFAALKSDGSIVTWGSSSTGGDSSSVSAELGSGVVGAASPIDWYAVTDGTGGDDNIAPIYNGEASLELLPKFGEQVSYDLRQYFSDPDGDTLTFSLSAALPSGLFLDTATGVITGQTTEADWDTPLTLTASDGRGGQVSMAVTLSIIEPPSHWDFSTIGTADVLTFGHLATDSYNGDVLGDGASTIIRPPAGWTAILTTWDGLGATPRNAEGELVPTLTSVVAPGMQATAYREDASGRVVVAYRGTDGDGVNPNPELLNTSSALIPTSLIKK